MSKIDFWFKFIIYLGLILAIVKLAYDIYQRRMAYNNINPNIGTTRSNRDFPMPNVNATNANHEQVSVTRAPLLSIGRNSVKSGTSASSIRVELPSEPSHVIPSNPKKPETKRLLSKGEKMCRTICSDIFPSLTPEHNYRDNKILENPNTKRSLEFDIYYPSIRLAVEFNGKQHYESSELYGAKHKSQIEKDDIKARLCVENKIVLITVPHIMNYARAKAFIMQSLRNAGIKFDSYKMVSRTTEETKRAQRPRRKPKNNIERNETLSEPELNSNETPELEKFFSVSSSNVIQIS